jgi:hypothetical protein
MKTGPVGAEFFTADGGTDERTDRHEATSRFSQFCELAQKGRKGGGKKEQVCDTRRPPVCDGVDMYNSRLASKLI